jgi:hypothetical protein
MVLKIKMVGEVARFAVAKADVHSPFMQEITKRNGRLLGSFSILSLNLEHFAVVLQSTQASMELCFSFGDQQASMLLLGPLIFCSILWSEMFEGQRNGKIGGSFTWVRQQCCWGSIS